MTDRSHGAVQPRRTFQQPCATANSRAAAAGGCDACVVIARPYGFVTKLTGALEARLGVGLQRAAGFVEYYDDRLVPAALLERLPPVLVKEWARFERERELRLWWPAPEPPTAPYIDLTVPELCEHVEVVALPTG